jgi:hypothetical protein
MGYRGRALSAKPTWPTTLPTRYRPWRMEFADNMMLGPGATGAHAVPDRRDTAGTKSFVPQRLRSPGPLSLFSVQERYNDPADSAHDEKH